MSDPKSPTPLVACGTVVETVDARGLKCPEPVMLFRNALRKAETGAQVALWATDPSTERDIPTMCRFMGHDLCSVTEEDGVYTYIVAARGAKSH